MNNVMFILSFYILRIILFQYFNYCILKLLVYERDILFGNAYIIQTGVVIIITILLSYLQFHWGYKIYKEIINAINKID